MDGEGAGACLPSAPAQEKAQVGRHSMEPCCLMYCCVSFSCPQSGWNDLELLDNSCQERQASTAITPRLHLALLGGGDGHIPQILCRFLICQMETTHQPCRIEAEMRSDERSLHNMCGLRGLGESTGSGDLALES